jgi:3-oxoadipate enol-lactonase|nr:alpha/beta hydrolase [Rhodanobacter sp. MP1X3]
MASFQSRDVSTCLGRLRVTVGGVGPAILFWPSLLMSAPMWAAQAEHFKDRFQVVLIDPPGHGDSEALQRTFTFEECARCIEQILDTLNITRAHFVGNSWGGMIGGTFAALYPDRVGAAVLMNCTGSAAGFRQKIEYAVLVRLVRTLGGIPSWLSFVPLRAFAGPTTERERPEVILAIREAVARVNGRSVHWAIRSVVPERPSQIDLFGTIRTPVLVLAGVEDRTFPVEETRAMAAAIPGAEFRVVTGVAHLAGLECPRIVDEIIDDFLSRAQLPAG